MSSITKKARKPWLAVLLTILTIGLGHLYSGYVKRGFFLFLGAHLLIVLVFSLAAFIPPYGAIVATSAAIVFPVFCYIDAYRSAKNRRENYELQRYNRWYYYLIIICVYGFITQPTLESLAKSNFSQAFKIPSGAMLDTMKIGDHIMCNKITYKFNEPKRGDIVIFPYPKTPSVSYVKRVIGLGGESIEIREKEVFINGNPLKEEYTIYASGKNLAASFGPRDNLGSIDIPTDAVFVMGDNRDNSHDSRFWGFVPKSSISGKVTFIYWSWDSEHSRVRWDRVGKLVN